MKNKIMEHFLYISNFFLELGIVITTVLVVTYIRQLAGNPSDSIQSSLNGKINQFCAAFYVLFVISAVFLILHIFFKKQYLILVKMHLTKKTIRLFLISFILAFFILLFSAVWIICIPLFAISWEIQLHWYFYVLIGIIMGLTLVDFCLDAYARFGVKEDLTKKRMGEPFGTKDELVKKDQVVIKD